MPIDTLWDRLRADGKNSTEAAKELGRRFGDKEAIEFFSGLWRKDDLWHAEALDALAAVGGLGLFVETLVRNEDVDGLVRVFGLGDTQWDVHAEAVETVKRMGDPRVAHWLITALPEWPSRGVIWALGELGETSAVEPLMRLLTKEPFDPTSWRERAEAAEALAKIGDTRAVEALVSALQHDHVSMRIQAAKALAAVTDSNALGRAGDAVRAALAPNYFTTRDWGRYETEMDEDIKAGASEDEIVFNRSQAARERAIEAEALKAMRTALDRIG